MGDLGKIVVLTGAPSYQRVGIVVGEDLVYVLPGPDYESGGEMFPRPGFVHAVEPSGYTVVE